MPEPRLVRPPSHALCRETENWSVRSTDRVRAAGTVTITTLNLITEYPAPAVDGSPHDFTQQYISN